MPCPSCIFCMRRVYSNARALTCDCCHRWHHIKCGDTGITAEQYDAAFRDGTENEFQCQRCRHEEVDGDGVQLMDDEEEDIDPLAPLAESTAMSLLWEETDVTREPPMERIKWLRCQPTNPPYPGRRRGTINRRPNSHQHSRRPATDQLQLHQHRKRSGTDEISVIRRLHKSQLKSGATVCRCSVRNKKISCQSTVHQIREEFSRSGTDHQQPAERGISINVKVKAELKTKAAENIFAPASSIITDVVDWHVTADQTPAARRPKTTRKSWRLWRESFPGSGETLRRRLRREGTSVRRKSPSSTSTWRNQCHECNMTVLWA